MSDGRHFIFLQSIGPISRYYHVQETGSASPLYEAASAGFLQNRLDVYKEEADARLKVLTIQPRGLTTSSYDVFSAGTDTIGTITWENVLGHQWVIRASRTGIFGNVCRTARSMNDLFGREYEIRINGHIISTLHLKQSLWGRRQAELNCSSNVEENIGEALLLSATLIIMDQRGSGGAEGGSG